MTRINASNSKGHASDICLPLKKEDRLAGGLCSLLVKRGETLKSLDTGLRGKVFKPQEESAAPNGKLEPQEVYHRAIEVMEEEIFPLGDISPKDERKLFSYKAWNLGFRIPWFFYDGNTKTRGDIDLRLRMRSEIDKMTPFNYARDIFELTKRLLPKYAEFPEMDVLDAVDAGKGDCTENSMLLYSLMRMAGLSAAIAFIPTNENGKRQLHVSAAAKFGDRPFFVDPVLSPDELPAPYADWRILPPLSFMAIHFRNRRIEANLVNDPRAANKAFKFVSIDLSAMGVIK